MKRPTSWMCLVAMLGILVTCPLANADGIISLNFSENSGNQGFVGGENIGPLRTNSTNWNNTNGQLDLANGSIADLIDDNGDPTSAWVIWSANNPWYNEDGTSDDQHKMAVGYLDDGGSGISIEIFDIPYTNYRVYGLYSSDQSGGSTVVTAQDMQVNGTWVFGGTTPTSIDAYGSITDTFAETGQYWSPMDSTTLGNYWTMDVFGNNSLNIVQSPVGDPGRAAIAGVIIRDLSVPFIEPMEALVNRDNGNITVTNPNDVAVDITGMSILSADGALTPDNWTSIAGNYDAPPGDQSVSTDMWSVVTDTESDLSEETLGSGTIAQNQSVDLGDGVWFKYFRDAGDITFQYVDAGTGATINGLIEVTGNGGTPFMPGDFDFNNVIDAGDWVKIRDGFAGDYSEATIARSYANGDLTGDLAVDLDDLLQFKGIYEAANGVGSFAALTGGVPEPASLALLALGGAIFLGVRRRPALLASLLVVAFVSTAAQADSIGVNFIGGQDPDDGASVNGTAGVVVQQANWNNVGGVGNIDDSVSGLVNDSGTVTTTSLRWLSATTWDTDNDADGNEDSNLMDGYIDATPGISGSRNIVTLTDIPYSFYDLYLYVGSDGDDRSGFTDLYGAPASAVWYLTSSAVDTFNGPADYVQATAADEASAVRANYVVYQDVGGPEVEIGLTRVSNNSGMHGLQIVEELNPLLLSLEIDMTTGATSIVNESGEAVSLDYYEIASVSNSLDMTSWSSLQAQSGDPPGDGSNWEELGHLSDSLLAEFNLQGNTTLAADTSLSLGNAFGGGAQDVAFRYNDLNAFPRQGLVTYIGDLANADTDSDNDVDGVDYLTIQTGVGKTGATLADGDTNGDTIVDDRDIDVWRDQFGMTVAAGGLAGAAVPEPGTLGLLGFLFAGLAVRFLRGH